MSLTTTLLGLEQLGPPDYVQRVARSTPVTKQEAIKEAKSRRAKGESVKVVRRSGVYTQPGRGVVAYVTFEVVPS